MVEFVSKKILRSYRQQEADYILMQRYSSRDSHWPIETIFAGLFGLPGLQSSEVSASTVGSASRQILFS